MRKAGEISKGEQAKFIFDDKYIRIHHRGDHLYVSGFDNLLIEPGSANTIVIRMKP